MTPVLSEPAALGDGIAASDANIAASERNANAVRRMLGCLTFLSSVFLPIQCYRPITVTPSATRARRVADSDRRRSAKVASVMDSRLIATFSRAPRTAEAAIKRPTRKSDNIDALDIGSSCPNRSKTPTALPPLPAEPRPHLAKNAVWPHPACAVLRTCPAATCTQLSRSKEEASRSIAFVNSRPAA